MAEKDGILRVEWQGPLALDEVAKLQKPMDAGLYAIYRPHVIYGRYTLVHIGMTCTTFGDRINARHPGVDVNTTSEIRVHVGRLSERPYDVKEFENLLKNVETLLIYAHTPAFNSNCITDNSVASLPDLRIFNINENGMILPEVSTARYRF